MQSFQFSRFFLIALALPYAALAAALPPQPISIDAGEVTYKLAEGKISFSGNVVVTQNNRTLMANALMANLTPKGELATMRATGGVVLKHTKNGITERAKSDSALYDIRNNTLALEGNATIIRGENTLKGEKLLYNLSDGTIKVTPKEGQRIRANLQPQNPK